MAVFFMYGYSFGQKKLVSPTHKAFKYIGRFDKSNPKKVKFDWPNTTIQFYFTGDSLALALKGGARNYFNIFIDNGLHSVIHQPKDSIIKINNIKGIEEHKITIQKRTEGEMGIAMFEGVYLPNNGQLITKKLDDISRKIEFIGNSITCGYGTEGKSRSEAFSPKTENVNQSYAILTSQAFNAECHIIAHSGLGVVRNYGDKNSISTDRATMPQRYHQVLDTDATLKWDFDFWKPDMVVINLGTNDYSTKPHPDKAIFQQTYMSLLENIQIRYGKIPVFLICGPLINEPVYTNIKELVDSMMEQNEDSNIHFIGIPKSLLNATTDLGSDSHPSYKGQIKMANHIIPTIATVMDWEFNTD